MAETRLLHPEANMVQQGAIFNCVAVPGYEDCACCGIVLTARCNLEHKKQSIVNYLPVVPFEGWARRELCFLLAKRLKNQYSGNFNNFSKQKGVSAQSLATFPARDIVVQESRGKEQARMLKVLNSLDLVEKVIAQERSVCTDIKELFSLEPKMLRRIIEELITQNLSEFYFLEQTDIDDKTQNGGSVVLLCNMQTITTNAIDAIDAGFTEEELPSTGMLHDHYFTFDYFPLCMMTGVLRSPEIEHLAQSFAALFTRIGIADQGATIVNSCLEIVKEL